MGRALLLALTCAAAVSAASYDDYSAVKMPQYGGGAEYDIGRDPSLSQTSDDYRGHSPDPPASPDYKYEEEPRVKTEKLAKELHDKKTWRRPGRKQRELVRSAESDTNLRKKYSLDDEDDDEIPKFRTNRRSNRHRSRLKHDIEEKEEEMPVPRRQNKFSRDRKDISDLDRKDYVNVDKEYNADDKNKDFDDGNKFNSGDEIIEGSDRNIKKPKGTFVDYDDDAHAGKHAKGEYDVKPIFPEDDVRFNRPVALRKLPGQMYPPAAEDDEESKSDPLKVIPGRFKLKGYNEYDDYYDMKRANNVKNRLPSLLRRTTEKEVVVKTSVSVAERELEAALGAKGAHRRRKDLSLVPENSTPITVMPLGVPTFSPQAVQPFVNIHWMDFMTSTQSKRQNISMILTF